MANTWITGRESKMVLQKAASWGSAVAAGAGDAIYFMSEALGAHAPVFLDDESMGQTDIQETRMVQKSAAGSFDCISRFDGFDMLFYLALGGSLLDGSPSNGDLHFYQSEANIEDLFASIAVLKSGTTNNVWEIPTATIIGFTISGTIGQYLMFNWEVMGDKIETETSTNTSGVIAAATYPTGVAPASEGQILMDSNFYIWMNAESDGALDTNDDLYPNSFSITYRRPMEPRFEATSLNAVEPIQSGFSEATIELGFDKLNSDAILDAITDEASQKLLLNFKGPLIGGSDYTEMQIYLPSVQWNSEDAPVAGPGPFPVTAVGRILKPSSVPTGMDNVKSIAAFDCDQAMNIYFKNNNAANPSA